MVKKTLFLFLILTGLSAAPSPYQSHNGYLGETVDTQTGALVLSNTDISLPGRNGMGISIARSYNSKHYATKNEYPNLTNPWEWDKDVTLWEPAFANQWAGYAGKGWQFSVGGQLFRTYYHFSRDRKFTKADPVLIDNLCIQLGNGKSYMFKMINHKIVPADPRVKEKLEQTKDGYVLYDQSGTKYYFDKKYFTKALDNFQIRDDDSGELQMAFDSNCVGYYLRRVENAYGDWIEYEYKTIDKWQDAGMYRRMLSDHTLPVKIKNSLGNEVSLEYNKKDQITALKIKNNNGQELVTTYTYDNQGQLIVATNPRGETTRYYYKKDIVGLIDSIKSPLGGVSRYTYYWQNFEDDSLDNYTILTKQLNDGSTNYLWKYEYKGGHTYDIGNGKQFCFAETTITDPRNIKTTHYYRNGYPIKEYLPNQVITEYEWDYKKGNKLKEITVKGPKRYMTEFKDYDEYGSPWLIVNHGDPDDPSDDKEMHNMYQFNSDTYQNQIIHSWVQAPGSSEKHNEVLFEYDRWGNMTKKEVLVTDQNHNNTSIITRYEYNNHGELTRKIFPNDQFVQYDYNYGSLWESQYSVRETSFNGNAWTEKFYDKKLGLLIREINSLGFGTEYAYDDFGFMTGKTDTKTNLTETYTYHSLTGDGGTTESTDAIGTVERNYIDRVGRKWKSEITPKGSFTRITKYEYSDSPELLTKVTDYLGRVSETKYDSMNRPVIQVNFDGTYMVTRYYDTFNYKEVYDVKKNKITYHYDAYGNLIKAVQPNEAITEYKYNIYGKLDNLITNTNSAEPQKNVRSVIDYVYDSIGRLTQIKKGPSITTLEYDNMDNVIRKTIPTQPGKFAIIENNYDIYSRLRRTDFRDSTGGVSSNIYVYCADQSNFGRIKSVQDGSGITTYDYDRFGNADQVTRTQFGKTRSTYYTYNNFGELLSIQYPGISDKVNYLYDERHRLANVEYQTDYFTKQTVMTYYYSTDKYERLYKSVAGNGVETKYGFDDHDRVNSIEAKADTIDRVFLHEYEYDELGNRKKLTWAMAQYGLHTVDYEYDPQYQVTKVMFDDHTRPFIYKYDDNGNRTFFSHQFGYDSYAIEQYDRLTVRYTGNNYRIAYAYDMRGNMTNADEYLYNKKIGSLQYDWDIQDRLLAQWKNGMKVNENAYDSRGMRVYSRVGTTEKQYWYGNGSEVLVDTDVTGNITAKYVMAGKQKLAVITKPTPAQGATPPVEGIWQYYHTDVLGSVVAMTDEKGKIIEINIYDPFGNTEFSYSPNSPPSSGPFGSAQGPNQERGNRYAYTGQEQDEFGGLMYYGARWYDSKLGRFISEDPATASPEDPLSINRYTYCRNNPLIYTDPTGMFFKEIFGAVGAVIGAVAGFFVGNPIGGAIAGWDIGTKIGGVVDVFGESIGKFLTGGSDIGGWVGGTAAGAYTSTFAMAEMSGASFGEATHAGAQAAGNPNTWYTAAAFKVVEMAFAQNPKTAEPVKKPTQKPTADQVKPKTPIPEKKQNFFNKAVNKVKSFFSDNPAGKGTYKAVETWGVNNGAPGPGWTEFGRQVITTAPGMGSSIGVGLSAFLGPEIGVPAGIIATGGAYAIGYGAIFWDQLGDPIIAGVKEYNGK
jgi:RHS repeat-associated protein